MGLPMTIFFGSDKFSPLCSFKWMLLALKRLYIESNHNSGIVVLQEIFEFLSCMNFFSLVPIIKKGETRRNENGWIIPRGEGELRAYLREPRKIVS
jgi:hypothetical protein